MSDQLSVAHTASGAPYGIAEWIRSAAIAINLLIGRMKTAETGKLEWAAVPASADATGTAGQIAYEDGFLYVCVAEDTWQRAELATWT